MNCCHHQQSNNKNPHPQSDGINCYSLLNSHHILCRFSTIHSEVPQTIYKPDQMQWLIFHYNSVLLFILHRPKNFYLITKAAFFICADNLYNFVQNLVISIWSWSSISTWPLTPKCQFHMSSFLERSVPVLVAKHDPIMTTRSKYATMMVNCNGDKCKLKPWNQILTGIHLLDLHGSTMFEYKQTWPHVFLQFLGTFILN